LKGLDWGGVRNIWREDGADLNKEGEGCDFVREGAAGGNGGEELRVA
jgi:hypothetical protein